MDLRQSLEEPISKFMSKDFLKVPTDWSVTQAANLMKVSEATEAIVTKDGRPIGIITERDILYKVVAGELEPGKTSVHEVMSSPIRSLDESARVLDAIEEMRKRGIRRLAVTKRGEIVGVITQKNVVSDKIEEQIPLPELSHPERLICPYCGAEEKDNEQLSKHIDQVHLGMGLLQGDKSKW